MHFSHFTNSSSTPRICSWETEVFEGRFHLPKSAPPYFEEWTTEFLAKVPHPNTRKRYSFPVEKLKSKFGGIRLSEISAERIEEYSEARLAEGVEPATINHDLRVLRRIMHLAERKQLIARSPFVQVEFLKQRSPQPPHIVTLDEEDTILRAAVPYIRVLVVLILETGMRSHSEALPLRWDAVDFVNDLIRVRESETRAGIRNIPPSARCKNELLRWRKLMGPDFSPFVFPNLRNPAEHTRDIRKSWAKALKGAGLEYFKVYNLRHSFASRLSAAGVSDLFVAQMIGHSTPSILQKYSKAIDEYRRDAVRKLEQMRAEHAPWPHGPSISVN